MFWREKVMIKLKKLDEPDVLKRNSKIWTEEYLDYISKGMEVPAPVKNRYAHPEIKRRLLEETHEKCAYCESKLTHITPGDIEHILPKNEEAHPELYVAWSNLTMACESCNRSGKKTYNNDEEPLLNPYIDEIEKEIFAAGPMIFAVAASRKGKLSIDILNLNRAALIERRSEALKKADLLRGYYEREVNESYKEILLEQMKEQIGEDKEFSFALKCFYKMAGIELG